MSKDLEDNIDGAPVGKSSPLPLVAALFGVLNLGATGFIATQVLALKGGGGGGSMSVEGHAAASEGHGGGGEHGGGGGEHGPPAVGLPMMAVDSFVVNLNEPGQSRYLKIGFEFELASTSALETLTASKRVMRDEVLRYLSSLTVGDTLGTEAKEKIAAEILVRVNRMLGGGHLAQRIYYTEFVVQ